MSTCIKEHGSTLPDEEHQRRRGRPRVSSLLDTLDSIESLGASSSCLQDQVLIFQAISNFPLLKYVNEPMTHFVCNDVRLAIRHLPAALHHKCDVPENIQDAHINLRPFRSLVSDQESPPLSGDMSYSNVTPCDGDGLVVGINLDHREPLENAEYTRFYGIDAPELSSVHFIKTNDFQHVFCKQVGHISLCAVHLFLQMFLLSGSAKLCEELPREAAPQPRDVYNRALKEYWFKFITPPSQHLEKVFLQSLEELVPPTSESRKRLMSPFPATMATAANPFLLSLNALLVVSGFCHVFTKYCQDGFLLGLQPIARDNKLGPICVVLLGSSFLGVLLETTSHLARAGFPFKHSNAFLPWHERQMLKQLCSQETTRTAARNHLAQHLPGMEPQFGMYIDIQRLVIIVE